MHSRKLFAFLYTSFVQISMCTSSGSPKLNILFEKILTQFSSCSFLLYESTNDYSLSQKISQDSYRFLNDPNNPNSSIQLASLDVHRFRDPCTFALLIFPTLTLPAASHLYKQIQDWSSTLKKDEDFYVFLTPAEDTILSSELSTGIKFKLIIHPQALTFKSVCFHCNEGKPSLTLITNSNLFPDFTINHFGRVFRVATPTGTKWLNEIRFIRGKWVAARGIYKIVMSNLQEKYNFSCIFFPSLIDGGTGTKLKNGSWIGSVGSVINKASDFGHVTGQTWSRNKVVGYTVPITFEQLTFTTGKPLARYPWQGVLLPLSYTVWIFIACSVILANIIIIYLLKKSQQKFDIVQTITYTVASLLEQDVPSTEKVKDNNAFRSFVCFWLLFTLVISTAYRSKLVSILSFPMLSPVPQSFEELASSHEYKFALQYLHGAAYALLRTSPNPTYRTIFSKMQLEEDEVSCFERVTGSKFACISWSTIADFVIRRNLSDRYGRVPLIKAAATTCFLSVGIIMEKRSIYLQTFNRFITSAEDCGLLKRWYDDDMRFIDGERKQWEEEEGKERRTWDEGSTDRRQLGNENLKGCYYLWAGGIFVGILCFVSEWLKNRCQKRL